MIRIFLLLLLLGSGAARAATTIEGVSFPDTFPADGQSLALNGVGLRTLTILRVKVYVAALYTARPSHDPQQIMTASTPKVLVLHFLHSGSKSDVERQFHNGETVNCGNGGCNPADQADFDRLVAAAPAVQPGDMFTFMITHSGVRFYANNQLLAQSSQARSGTADTARFHRRPSAVGGPARPPAWPRQLMRRSPRAAATVLANRPSSRAATGAI